MAIVLLFAGGFISSIAGSSLQGAFDILVRGRKMRVGQRANVPTALLPFYGEIPVFQKTRRVIPFFSPFARTHLSSLAAEESGSVSVSVWVLDLG